MPEEEEKAETAAPVSLIPLLGSDTDSIRTDLAAKEGIQRSTRYEVFISSPTGFLRWPVLSVSLPGRSLEAVPDDLLSQGDNKRTVPVRRGYGGEPSVLLGLYVDTKWDIRTFFEDWADQFNPMAYESMADPMPNYISRGSYSDLVSSSSVVISFFDLKDQIRWQMSLIEPYISTIIQENYSEERLNEFAVLNVAIAFKEYITEQY